MIPNTYIALFILFATLIISYFITKRYGNKGCIFYAYVSLVVLCINLFTLFSWMFMYDTTTDIHSVITSGEKHTANVVNYTAKEHYDSEDDTHYTMYTPIVQFRTNSGKLIYESLSFSTSSIDTDKQYIVNYNTESGKIITLGYSIVLSTTGAFLFWSIFTTGFLTMILYASGMKKYYSFASIIGLNFLTPFIMIGFDGALIYSLFYGNDGSTFTTILLCVFILVLSLGLLAYMKMIFSNIKAKFKRVSPTRWEAN